MISSRSLQEIALEDCMSAIIDYRGKTPRKTSIGIPLITAKIVKGGRIETPDEFIDPAEYDSWMRRGLPKIGDVVLTTEAPLGEVAQLTTDRIALAQRLILLRGKPNVLDNGYLKYMLMSEAVQSQLHGRASGTTVVGIKQSELRKVVFHLPSISEQRAIANALGALDDKIEQNRRTSAALELLARAIFRAWFVDFEPIKAKAAGAVSFPSMPQPVFDVLPTTFISSELGPIPFGWDIKPLSAVVNLTMGQSPSSEFYNETGHGLPFHQGVTDFGYRFPSNRVYCTTEGRIADAGDILLSVRAPVGRINVTDSRIMLGRGLAGLRHKANRQSSLLYQLRHIFATEDAIGDGTIYKAVTKTFLSSMSLVVPADAIQEAFESVISPVDALIEACERESVALEATRDYLLPKLLSGKVHVRSSNG
jgi:type I restriction enzyme S subunit